MFVFYSVKYYSKLPLTPLGPNYHNIYNIITNYNYFLNATNYKNLNEINKF